MKPFEEQGNWTAVHNAAFDYIMPNVSANAWKVLSLIIRRTDGWDKKADSISYSQIKDGTGISSDHTVSRALDELLEGVAFGCAVIRKRANSDKRKGTIYGLNRKFLIPDNAVLTTAKNAVAEDGATAKNAERSTAKNADTKQIERNNNRGGVENTEVPADETQTPPRNFQHFNTKTQGFPNPLDYWPNGGQSVLDSLMDAAKLTTLDARDCDELRQILPFLKQRYGQASDAAKEVRRRYCRPTWKKEFPVRLSQIITMWEIQGDGADNLNSTPMYQRPEPARTALDAQSTEAMLAARNARRAELKASVLQ